MQPEPNAETIRSLEEELANLSSLVEKMEADNPSPDQAEFITQLHETLADLKTRIEHLKKSIQEIETPLSEMKAIHDPLIEDYFRRQWGLILAFGGVLLTLIFALFRR
jgi:hypothetical protein